MPIAPDDALAFWRPGLPLAVAFSGGADSTALLLACVRRWPGRVHAVHVHHGLQAAADQFEAFCRTQCEAWQVPLAVVHVDARPAPGQSPEEAARRARYTALAQALHTHWGGQVRDVALAQHADDQMETLLIALSRGAGLAGLAGMPAQWQREGLQWHRPWLGLGAATLRQWLQAQGQVWVEDPSNQDPRYTRNRIRAQVLPALRQALPGFEDTFARSMRHIAQAQTLLQAMAAQDWAAMGQEAPVIAALQALPRARQAGVLRLWLGQIHQTTPSTAQLEELLDQVAACTTRGHLLHLRVGRGWVQRRGPLLVWHD